MVRKLQDIQESTKTVLKSGVHKSRDFDEGYRKRTNSKVRLRGDRDHVWVSRTKLNSSITDATGINRKCSKQCYRPVKVSGFTENSLNIEKRRNKNDLSQPKEIDIKNIIQTQYIPAKLQKLIIPRNNMKLQCNTLRYFLYLSLEGHLPKLSFSQVFNS
ncbi:uncharacterized protein LOC143153928 isoform X2 [Ptiloglossa arizonensis]|uniref:uncharacterized protein LOC143153928 isoform X2 n=1 Tax=Ptiloglossa arizonensis TaxID=3350558 RepID=UPI003FA0C798